MRDFYLPGFIINAIGIAKLENGWVWDKSAKQLKDVGFNLQFHAKLLFNFVLNAFGKPQNILRSAVAMIHEY